MPVPALGKVEEELCKALTPCTKSHARYYLAYGYVRPVSINFHVPFLFYHDISYVFTIIFVTKFSIILILHRF